MTARPRILYLVPRFPWPADRGDRIRGLGLIRQFTQFADVTLVSFTDGDPAAVDLGPMVTLCERVEVLAHPTWRGRLNMVAAIPERVPFQVAFYRSESMTELMRRLSDEPFDLVFGQMFRMHPYMLPFTRSRTVMDLGDSLAMNLRRAVRTKPGLKQLAFRMEHERVSRYEVEVMSAVEESWVVAEADREDLLRRAPSARIVVLPNGVDDRFGSGVDPARAGQRAVLLGNLTVGHNIDMAVHLVETIWPLIRTAQPRAELWLVGEAGTTVRRLASHPGVRLTGFVDDLSSVLAGARVALAPLRYGAGIQNKVLVTMAAGLPTVVSSIVNTGIAAEPGHAIDVADDPASFAAAVIRHMVDPTRAATMGQAARRHVMAKFSWEPTGRHMRALLGL